ncbi:MAG TPA: spermidine/putrescine ABC transporter ATP-binding protein [Anaerolineae bacterium]|nr:spermidine/putrescine ABC transporter ATP-binding protein [Anaerolineae bacterium]
MLELRHVSKSFNQKNILQNISFKIKKGETICLLGASGSGKSTILKMIAGLDFPDGGQILFNKIDLASTPPHLRDFGLVFQDFNLFPHLNVFDNIAFGLKMRNENTQQIQLRVAALLEQVNLSGFEKRNISELSGGEQQRVALARALAPQPRLLMFDEPLGALDKSLKEDLLSQLRNILHKEKIPAIYVTHDAEEAFAIADRILILHDGVIIRDDTPEEIWKNPKYVEVAKILGIGNVVEGEVIAKNKVKTEFGILNIDCKQNQGEKVDLLLTQSSKGEVINVKVEDIVYKQNQFEVKSRGGVLSGEAVSKGVKFLIKEKPKIGETIKVNVQVGCLE